MSLAETITFSVEWPGGTNRTPSDSLASVTGWNNILDLVATAKRSQDSGGFFLTFVQHAPTPVHGIGAGVLGLMAFGLDGEAYYPDEGTLTEVTISCNGSN